MKPIAGSLSITLAPAEIVPAHPPYTYFGVAESLMPGVRVLSSALPVCAHALSFVAAHVLECLLKAYLSKAGSNASLKKLNVRHDLNRLWGMACEAGLEIEQSPPSWVDRLSNLHASPYYLRYSKGVHGIVLPEAEPMTSELASLLNIVRGRLA